MFIFNFFKLFRDIFVYSNFTYFKVDSIGSEIELTAVVPDDTFTVTQAVNALGFGKFQILVKYWKKQLYHFWILKETFLSIK
jgi:hypothetical protein